MSNVLITSFFSSSAASQIEPEIERPKLVNELPCSNGVTMNGLTVDLGGLLHAASDKRKTKKKQSFRKKGSIDVTQQPEDDVTVELDGNGKEEAVCEELSVVEAEQEKTLWPSPSKQKATLSSSWQRVFGRQQKKSPVRKAIASPKRCRSPKQPAQCRSPRQPAQCQKSPLKQSVKRQLLTTPPIARGPSPIFDHAPYKQLVHISQSEEPLPSNRGHPLVGVAMKEVSPMLPSRSIDVEQCLGLSEHHSLPRTTPHFEQITDRSVCLHELQSEHPFALITDLYSRYSSLTRKSHPCSGSKLRCSIAVKVGGDGRITVDHSLYPRPFELQDHMYSDLWSSIYRPRKCSEVIGNADQCSKLCGWLRKWKAERATPEVDKKVTSTASRAARQSRKSEEWWFSDRDDDFVFPNRERRTKRKSGLARKYLDSDSDAESADEDEVKSVMLLCGPPGSGKTAAVYACAQEMEFGVYEVNSSSSRGRGQMLSTLREVSLSHLVAQRKRTGLTIVEKNKLPQTVALENNTLILLEEVDILFDEEERGFWSAVYEIIRTTKRPFVMTCSDAKVRLTCPHSQLLFTRPPVSELALHIRLLSLTHGVSLTSKVSNQIVSSFNSDIRKTFHFMHTWLIWSPSNHSEAPPQSSRLPSPYRLSTNWRYSHLSSTTPKRSSFQQSDLFIATVTADNLATLDLLTSLEVDDLEPWWKVVPVNYLLDELSTAGQSDVSVTRTEQDIAMEIMRLSGAQRSQQPSSVSALHHSLSACSKSFSPVWQLAHVAMATEGLPFLRLLSILDNHRKVLCSKRRFQSYLKYSDIATENLSMLTEANCFTSK